MDINQWECPPTLPAWFLGARTWLWLPDWQSSPFAGESWPPESSSSICCPFPPAWSSSRIFNWLRSSCPSSPSPSWWVAGDPGQWIQHSAVSCKTEGQQVEQLDLEEEEEEESHPCLSQSPGGLCISCKGYLGSSSSLFGVIVQCRPYRIYSKKWPQDPAVDPGVDPAVDPKVDPVVDLYYK